MNLPFFSLLRKNKSNFFFFASSTLLLHYYFCYWIFFLLILRKRLRVESLLVEKTAKGNSSVSLQSDLRSEDCDATSKWQGQVWGLNSLFYVTEFYLHLPWAPLELFPSLQSEVGALEEQIVHHLSILIQISLVQLAAQSRAAWFPKMSIPSSRTPT